MNLRRRICSLGEADRVEGKERVPRHSHLGHGGAAAARRSASRLLVSGCGGRETEEQDAGREDGDELLPGQCGARAVLAWRAEFAPSRSEGRRE